MEVLASIFKGLGRLFLQPIFLIVLLIVVSGSGIYLFTQNKTIEGELSRLRDDPEAAAQKEVDELVAKVGDLMDLPKDEQPTLATVTDAESVRDQAFFASSENGDRVLIYTEAKKAILYRPSIGKIIEIAPVNIGQTEGLDQEKEVLAEEDTNSDVVVEEITSVQLALSNGTSKAGLTVVASGDIKEKVSSLEINVVSRTDAEGDMDNTLVVVLSDGYDEIASTIAEAVGGTVGDLPEGEDTPDADILVILGEDYLE